VGSLALFSSSDRKSSSAFFLAAASLAMLSPVARSGVEIDTDKKLEIDANSLG
jgi:hypothetical protein